LKDDLITSILEDHAGGLWIGTYDGGLKLFKDDQITVYNSKDGLSSDTVSAIYEDREGSLWIGTAYVIGRCLERLGKHR